MSKAFEDAQEHQVELKKAWREIALSQNGKTVIEDLEMRFAPRSLIKMKDGIVDPYATLSANGAYEVISYIRNYINE